MRLTPANGIALEPASPGSSPSRIQEAARELESQFARMLIQSMRSASMGDPMLGNDTTYREMYDQQLARELTKGRGLGLAPVIARQLERSAAAATPAAPAGGLPLRPPGAPMPMPAAPVALPLAPASSGVSMPAMPAGSSASVAAPANAATAADPALACPPDTPLDCSSPEAFVRSIWPMAQHTAAQLGVPAKALVAQAALETGWGRRLANEGGVTSHNLFGIKAGGRWSGPRMSSATHEFVDGVRRNERADFRAYGSASESFADYARLLGNGRYAAARGTGEDVRGFARALQQAGYATDPAYADKIAAIANGATLNRALAAMPGATYAAATVVAPTHSKG